MVTSIISLGVVALLPGVSMARSRATDVRCVANLHQLSQAFRLYLDDHEERLPPNGVPCVADLSDLDRLWFRQIGPYLRHPDALHCPADPVRDGRRALSGALPAAHSLPSIPALSYGANWDLVDLAARGDPRACLASLRYPAQTLLVADCTEPWAFGPIYRDPSGVMWSHIAFANGPPIADPEYIYFHGGRSGAGHERHRNGSFVAFVDGHVTYFPSTAFLRERRSFPPTGTQKRTIVEWQQPLISPDAQPTEAAPTAVTDVGRR